MSTLRVIHLSPITFLPVFLSFYNSNLLTVLTSFFFYFCVWILSQIVRLPSNPSLISWAPGYLEFVSSIAIFISSFPDFQIDFFFHGLLFCFYYAYFCVSMSCFIFMVLTPYDLWKIPTKLILKLFSHHPIIFNLCLMNLSPDCWFCCCFLKSFLSVILFCRLILTGIITSPLQTTSVYTDFVVAPNSWPCTASVHNRAYIGDAEFQSCSILSSYVTLVAWPRS